MSQNNNFTRKVLHRKLNFLRILGSSFGCCMGVGVIGYLSTVTYSALIIPSFGASCVIGLVTPDSAFAQPRNVVGGHLLSSVIGLLCAIYMGISWWSFAAAIGLSVAIMQLTRTVHPPAAADPIFFMQTGISLQLLIPVLLGTVILVTFFVAFHRWVTRRHYPKFWL